MTTLVCVIWKNITSVGSGSVYIFYGNRIIKCAGRQGGGSLLPRNTLASKTSAYICINDEQNR